MWGSISCLMRSHFSTLIGFDLNPLRPTTRSATREIWIKEPGKEKTQSSHSLIKRLQLSATQMCTRMQYRNLRQHNLRCGQVDVLDKQLC